MSPFKNKKSGFTLLEVIITISLLAAIMISVTALLSGSLDMKLALSQRTQIAATINRVMTIMAEDLTHSFMLSVNEDKERVSQGVPRTIFEYSNFAGRPKVAFTSMRNTSIKRNAGEGELSYIVYEIRDSERYPGRKDLYRGVTGVVPTDFKDEPAMKALAVGIKSIKLEMWNGSDWREEWSTKKSEFKQSIPKMIRITVVGYSTVPEEGQADEATETDEFDTTRVSVVYLPYSQRFEELKSGSSTINF